MIDSKYVEWMNMAIDGVLPPDELRELHDYISSDPDAASFYESLKSTVAAVDATEDPGPPPHLEKRILAEGPWNSSTPAPAPAGIWTRLGRWFSTPAFRYAAVFCCGIVTGLFLLFAINFDGGDAGGQLQNSFLSGTMRQITTEEGLKRTQDYKVDLEQARGHVSLYESENILLTEINLNSPGTIEWTLQYDANNVVFEGYRRFEQESGNIDVARSAMRVSQTGDARYLFFFTRRDAHADPMVIKLFSADRLLLEKPLVPTTD